MRIKILRIAELNTKIAPILDTILVVRDELVELRVEHERNKPPELSIWVTLSILFVSNLRPQPMKVVLSQRTSHRRMRPFYGYGAAPKDPAG